MGLISGRDGQLFDTPEQTQNKPDPQANRSQQNDLIQSNPGLKRLCTVVNSAIKSNKDQPIVLQIKAPLSKQTAEFVVSKQDLVPFFSMLRIALDKARPLFDAIPGSEVKLPFFRMAVAKNIQANSIPSCQLLIGSGNKALLEVRSQNETLRFDIEVCNLQKSPMNQLFEKSKQLVGESMPAIKAPTVITPVEQATIEESIRPSMEGLGADEIAHLSQELL